MGRYTPGMRIGIGVDVHQFASGRKLILGGVEVPFERGLLGHSDADVLTHAICDALLGAAGLGDIGVHFSDLDPAYKDISSLILLERTVGMVEAKGFQASNVDATVICQAPKLAPHFPSMRQSLAKRLHVDVGCVNLKATTSEGLGYTGKGEGIAAWAVALLRPISL